MGDDDHGVVRECRHGRLVEPVSRDVESALARVRVGPVLYPTVLLAFADGARFQQHGHAQPRSVLIAGRLSVVISTDSLLPGTNPSGRSAVPRA